MDKSNLFKIFILFVIIIFIQLFTSLLGIEYYLTQLTMSAYYTLATIGLCLLMGYAGQVSMGQAGFFAIGGYVAAVFSTINFINYKSFFLVKLLNNLTILTHRIDIYGNEILSFSGWFSFISMLIITILIAYSIGKPVLSLKGHYLAMATLAFTTIIHRIVLGTKLFGEADGISNVPEFKLLPFLSVSGDFHKRIENYYFAWILVIICIIILLNLINSRPGRAIRSLHGGEEASNSMGINTSYYKIVVFIISAVYASLAGFFMTYYNGGIGPSEASVLKSVRYVALVAVGGMANIWGTLIISTILNFLSLRGIFGTFDDFVFGAILILVFLINLDDFRNLINKIKNKNLDNT